MVATRQTGCWKRAAGLEFGADLGHGLHFPVNRQSSMRNCIRRAPPCQDRSEPDQELHRSGDILSTRQRSRRDVDRPDLLLKIRLIVCFDTQSASGHVQSHPWLNSNVKKDQRHGSVKGLRSRRLAN
jgi:hypothetical protein